MENNVTENLEYALAFEREMAALERQLHSEEDPELIAQKTLIAAAELREFIRRLTKKKQIRLRKNEGNRQLSGISQYTI